MSQNNKTTWIFDLDDTLYPRENGLWTQITARISHYIKNHLNISDDEVIERRQFYNETSGGALQGLMKESQVDTEDFLAFVHDVDYSELTKDTALYDAISALEGKKYIFTNGDRPHAERTLKYLGLNGLFDDIYDIVAGNLVPKPFFETYERLLKLYNLSAENIVLFEDSLINLQTAKKLGMTTVLIGPKPEPFPSFVDRQEDNLQAYFCIKQEI